MTSIKCRRKVRRRYAALLSAAVAAATPLIATAANTDNFTGTSGQDWNTPAHWNTVLVPGTGDTVNITETPGSLFSVTFDSNYTTATALSSLTVDGSSTIGVVLNQGTAGDNLYCPSETIGNNGIGTFNQTAAINTSTSDIFLGWNSTAQGTYLLGNGASLSAFNVWVGVSGSGTFKQSGGTANAWSIFEGAATGGSGLYSLSGTGILAVSSYEYIGYSTTGSFVQSGGTHTSSTWLYMGYYTGSKGSYALSAGTLSSNQISVGYQGIGTFAQTGGTHTVANFLTIGDQTAGSGLYTLSGGSLSAPTENIAYAGTGTFIQSGGTNTTTSLVLGVQGGTGSYTLSGTGVLNSVNSAEIVGQSGTGTFIQTGGSNNLGTGRLSVAVVPGYQSSYNLSGGSVTAGTVTIGGISVPAGVGSLVVSGTGTLNLPAELAVFSGSSIALLGGSITAGDLNTFSTPGDFLWTAGSLTLTNSSLVFDSTASGVSSSLGSSLTLSSGQSLQLTSGSESIGGNGIGSLTLKSGSINTISGTTTINPLGTLTLSGGTLNTSGTLLNLGNFSYVSGTLAGRLVNQGTVTLASVANLAPSNGVENDTNMTVGVGQTLTLNGPGLDNLGTFNLSGGAIGGAGAVFNDFGSVMNAYGTISQGLTNNGTLNVNGLLTQSAASSNSGQINVASASQLRGSTLANNGVITLNGGAVSAALTNNSGGVIQGYGGISNFQGNTLGGQISVSPSSGPLNISNAWTNSGIVMLKGAGAVLSGGAITNTGTIQGNGQISGAVLNTAGALQPSGGQLVLAGSGNTNASAAQIQITTGNTLLYSQGLAINAGSIALSGGTFDNNNQPLTNSGNILGNGTIRTGGLTNSGTVSFADAPANVLGAVTNNGSLKITNDTATFYGSVTNGPAGTIKVTTGVARFLSTFTNNGTYNSDPADNYFTDLTVSTTGALIGGVGDRFFIAGNFTSSSDQNRLWNTASSLIDLQGATSHSFSVTGMDGGRASDGYINNFAIGTLQLDSGGSLSLSPEGADSALYVEALVLGDGLNQVSSITGNGANVYYDPSNPANAYLGDQSYALSGGGEIAPVPEPASGLTIALAAPLLVRRRRRRIAIIAINSLWNALVPNYIKNLRDQRRFNSCSWLRNRLQIRSFRAALDCMSKF